MAAGHAAKDAGHKCCRSPFLPAAHKPLQVLYCLKQLADTCPPARPPTLCKWMAGCCNYYHSKPIDAPSCSRKSRKLRSVAPTDSRAETFEKQAWNCCNPSFGFLGLQTNSENGGPHLSCQWKRSRHARECQSGSLADQSCSYYVLHAFWVRA